MQSERRVLSDGRKQKWIYIYHSLQDCHSLYSGLQTICIVAVRVCYRSKPLCMPETARTGGTGKLPADRTRPRCWNSFEGGSLNEFD